MQTPTAQFEQQPGSPHRKPHWSGQLQSWKQGPQFSPFVSNSQTKSLSHAQSLQPEVCQFSHGRSQTASKSQQSLHVSQAHCSEQTRCRVVSAQHGPCSVSVLSGVQGSLAQTPPHVQAAVQVSVPPPQFPQPRVAPAAHTPSPEHVPQVHAAVQVREPQFPHEPLPPGAQTPSPPHPPQAPQVQSAAHRRDCVPQLPHARDSVAPGAQAPSPTQPDQSSQLQSAAQERVCSPQLPQLRVSAAPGEHAPWPHSPQALH